MMFNEVLTQYQDILKIYLRSIAAKKHFQEDLSSQFVTTNCWVTHTTEAMKTSSGASATIQFEHRIRNTARIVRYIEIWRAPAPTDNG